MSENNSNFYEVEAGHYDERRFSHPLGRIIDLIQKKIVSELCTYKIGDVLLDVGTGTGRFAIELANNFRNVIGVDPSVSMIEASRKKIDSACTQNNIELLIANAEFLPFRKNSIQQSISINVLNHIIDYQIVLDEIVRVIQKQGTFLANYPILQSIYFPVGVYVNLFKRDVFLGVYSKWFKINEIRKSYSTRNLVIDEKRGYFSPPFPLSNKLSNFVSRFLLESNKLVNDSILKYFSGVLFIRAKRH